MSTQTARKHVMFKVKHAAADVPEGQQGGGATAATAPAPAASATESGSGVAAHKKISPKMILGMESVDTFAVRHSNDGRLVAAGAGDGSVWVYNALSGEVAFRLMPPQPKALPVTSVRWRPEARTGATAKHVLLVGCSDGTVRHWHVTSSKCISALTEKDNQVFAADYRSDAEKFVTAGKDARLRLYDDLTKTCELVMTGGVGPDCAGHTSRVFSVRFSAQDPNVVVSGGWDNTVQFWDCRVGRSVRSIFGPHVCGDAVDIREGVVLTGSWKPKDQVQLWDAGSGRLILSADVKATATGEPCLLYAAQFSRRGQWFAVGGSGANEARVYSINGQQAVAELTGFDGGIFSLDFAPDDSSLLVAGPKTLRSFDARAFSATS
jgi:WD40 repeat protein